MIAFGIGLCSILDLYAQVSLNAQDLNLFPTTVACASLKMCADLKDLSDEWKWPNEDLKLAGTGHPMHIIQNLEKGIYKPHLSQAVKIDATRRINVQIHENERFRDSIADVDDTVQDLLKLNCNKVTTSDLNIPEIPVTGFEAQDRNEVENKLKNLCGNLVKAFNERVKVPKLIKDSITCFATDNVHNEHEQANQLQQIVNEIKGPKAEYFQDTTDPCLVGLKMFKDFAKNERNKNTKIRLEEVYKKFIGQFCIPQTKVFRELFEFIQIRTYSEAICETVGSIMTIAMGTGRNLSPVNLSKEVCLRFNLPPLHICKESIIPIIVQELVNERAKTYTRKGDKDNRISRFFKYTHISSALGNFRKKEEDTAHLPIEVFKG